MSKVRFYCYDCGAHGDEDHECESGSLDPWDLCGRDHVRLGYQEEDDEYRRCKTRRYPVR